MFNTTGEFIPIILFGLKNLPSSWLKSIKQYLKGFFLYGMLQGIDNEKRRLDGLVKLCVFGRFIGIPGLFNYYHLKLMPYYIGQLYGWKRRVLREKDFLDHLSD